MPSFPGTVVIHPRSDHIHKIVIDSGPGERRHGATTSNDLAADPLAFGEEPSKLVSFAYMTDTDNTRSRAETWYGEDQKLRPRPDERAQPSRSPKPRVRHPALMRPADHSAELDQPGPVGHGGGHHGRRRAHWPQRQAGVHVTTARHFGHLPSARRDLAVGRCRGYPVCVRRVAMLVAALSI